MENENVGELIKDNMWREDWGKVLSLLHVPMRIWKSWAKLNLIFIRKVSKSFFKIKLLSSNVLLDTILETICINLLSASSQLIRKLWLNLNFFKFMDLKTCLGLMYFLTLKYLVMLKMIVEPSKLMSYQIGKD